MKPNAVGAAADWGTLFRRAAAVVGIALVSTCCFGVLRQDAEEQQRTCVSNLKQLSLGMLMYVQDYDERYPPMKFASQIHERIYPYIKNRSVFACPATGADYVPNPALNYLYANRVAAPATTIQVCDAKPHATASGGSAWNVAYADGHVSTIDSEPKLGKPAPSPTALTHAQQVRAELRLLREQRAMLDKQIRKLEAEQRRSKGKR